MIFSLPQRENAEANYGRSRSYRRDVRIESQSAPLFAENRTMPPSERLLRMRSSLTREFSTYALPTPVETSRSPSSITRLANNNNNNMDSFLVQLQVNPYLTSLSPQHLVYTLVQSHGVQFPSYQKCQHLHQLLLPLHLSQHH
ncbi:unnamed protein product [Eruca vesicaria subsp. sativa]|uniref:Uncharacterized protein n=1 Tax=Eruca vesicaria subsp. sativa TaxID=29727 RepID=A0ABC8JRZ6_ERUVS|nr:unnamed protein product [Eruca vesicaria subsp. sativa]